MTVLISFHQPNMIIMSADNRETDTATPDTSINTSFEPIITFDTKNKIFSIDGVGCVSMWGDFSYIKEAFDFFPYLKDNTNRTQNVEELKDFVAVYLKKDLKPHELNYDTGRDVGFHIGGFMPNGESRLYHVFYGKNRGEHVPPDEKPDYHTHQVPINSILYNGRNDYADLLVKFINGIQKRAKIAIFENDPKRLIILSDFIIRFISQYTADVGDNIRTVLIKPNNQMLHLVKVIPLEELEKLIDNLK